MNVNDVSSIIAPKSHQEKAKIIFDRQSELEDEYWQLEKRPSKVINILNRPGQVIFKDFLWRITEEIGEALEAKNNRESQQKIYEEMADGLHFVTGLCVITDNEKSFIQVFSELPPLMSMTLGTACYRYIQDAGTLGNTLKLKPWKQTDVVTDVPEFNSNLKLLIRAYLQICWSLGMGHDSLFDYYYRKSEVNKFRIQSKY